ncbi:MAG: DegT/DnrJ/EryC1/StrS family aminotransferase, partial [Chitinispirillaceae bacterium]|nr:DegT/DnrJ/EryC1/StrS family aminotransferase [Chitinispirillaceae bacterium]
DEIIKIAEKYHLVVIEDCAHAIESVYKGKKCGTFGDFGCFSFYVTKNITTGEGGMVITKKADDAEKIKRLALHGLSADAWKRFGDEGYKHYFVVDCGFKYNMMDIQAAIGIHQLKKIDIYRQKRENIKKRYDEAFKDLPIISSSPLIDRDSVDSYHLYQILINEKECGISRDEFLQQMTYHGIGVGVHYLSLPEHPYYQKMYGWRVEDYPNAKKIGRETVSLPLSPKLSEKDVEDVISAVRTIILREI